MSQEELLSAMLLTPNDKVKEMVNKINETFEYWDTVKYKRCPDGCTPQQLWTYVKAARVKSMMSVWGKYGISLTLTNQMQRMCHEIDMNWGRSWGTDSIIGDENKEQYLVGSLMEEAIYSSQMEGAATTRKVAKEMLRKKMTPKDKSQQMISNNYQTIQFIVSHKDVPLTPELLLQIHQLMTEHTMQNLRIRDALEGTMMWWWKMGLLMRRCIHRQPLKKSPTSWKTCAFFSMRKMRHSLSILSSVASSFILWWHTFILLQMAMVARRVPCFIGTC